MNKNQFFLLPLALVVFFTSCKPSYQKTKGGISYRIVVSEGKPKIMQGEMVKFDASWRRQKDDSLIQTSAKMPGDHVTMIQMPQQPGDPMEIFPLMGKGDSIEFLMPVELYFQSVYLPKGFQHGDNVVVGLRILDAYTYADYKKHQDSVLEIAAIKEDSDIVQYARENNLHLQKTKSGLYYEIENPGSGAKPKTGERVNVKYKGSLLSGMVFDSSGKPKQPPFSFMVGVGSVVHGFDEGVQLISAGGKAKLIIPSKLGYGPTENGKIPANSVLVFDIELQKITGR
jgi:FKBP-type peptidyl-prolyl cis-trans isomerase FkpA